MPTETKRLTGPESTIPYRLYSVKNVKSYDQLLSEVVGKDGLRRDKRAMNDARSMFAEIGCVTEAKGSAYVEMGKTKVIVSVFDPKETPKQNAPDGLGELHCEVKFAPFSAINRVQLQPNAEEKEMAAAMKRALDPTVLRHLFPNFLIEIMAYVLENDGACLSSIINAAGLALADAEVPIYDSITALTLGIQGDMIFIDPVADEEKLCLINHRNGNNQSNHGLVVKAILPALQQVTEFSQHGAISLDTMLDTLDSYQETYKSLYDYMHSILAVKCKTILKKKQNEDKRKLELENLVEKLKDTIIVDDE